MLDLDNPFWTFSVAVYGVPGVADECLVLQDRHGVNVNVLLFSAWTGAQKGLLLSAADFQVLTNAVRDWQVSVVKPLRAVRRALKPHATDDAAVAALRADVMRDELKAEQIEQGLLYAKAGLLDGARAQPHEAVRQNVAALMAWQKAERPPTVAKADTVAGCPLLIAAAARTA